MSYISQIQKGCAHILHPCIGKCNFAIRKLKFNKNNDESKKTENGNDWWR